MLTRDDGTLNRFYWDGWDMVRETTGSSTTEYLIPEGGLLSFKRDGVTNDDSCDALGSVRLVTDEVGEVVSRFGFMGQAIATTGTGMTFWGFGIGPPKIMPKVRDAGIPKGNIDNYALKPE